MSTASFTVKLTSALYAKIRNRREGMKVRRRGVKIRFVREIALEMPHQRFTLHVHAKHRLRSSTVRMLYLKRTFGSGRDMFK